MATVIPYFSSLIYNKFVCSIGINNIVLINCVSSVANLLDTVSAFFQVIKRDRTIRAACHLLASNIFPLLRGIIVPLQLELHARKCNSIITITVITRYALLKQLDFRCFRCIFRVDRNIIQPLFQLVIVTRISLYTSHRNGYQKRLYSADNRLRRCSFNYKVKAHTEVSKFDLACIICLFFNSNYVFLYRFQQILSIIALDFCAIFRFFFKKVLYFRLCFICCSIIVFQQV